MQALSQRRDSGQPNTSDVFFAIEHRISLFRLGFVVACFVVPRLKLGHHSYRGGAEKFSIRHYIGKCEKGNGKAMKSYLEIAGVLAVALYQTGQELRTMKTMRKKRLL